MLATKFTTHVGGNIGRPLLLDLPNIRPDDVVVLELSSFMLEYLRELEWSPHVAVVTMLSADHLDWHGSPEAYLDAKKLIVKHQTPADIAVLADGEMHTPELSRITRARVVMFSGKALPQFELKVPGWHNQFNCQAAWTAARELGVTFEDAARAVSDFQGLPHRLQIVHESGGVRWFNDSIATIPEAAVAALEAFPRRSVLQIVGGSDKGLNFTSLAAALCERSKAVLCIGTTGPKIAALIAESTTHDCAPVYECGDLATAVKMARSIATAGDVVLLSTGCASYDQFDNFEQRGDSFARLARQSDPSDVTAARNRRGSAVLLSICQRLHGNLYFRHVLRRVALKDHSRSFKVDFARRWMNSVAFVLRVLEDLRIGRPHLIVRSDVGERHASRRRKLAHGDPVDGRRRCGGGASRPRNPRRLPCTRHRSAASSPGRRYDDPSPARSSKSLREQSA